MKINELSKITFIHPETIRMYRNMGLLHPKKLENGYYEYSTQDFVSLVYLRKLREYNFSIEEIQEYEASSYQDLLQTLSHKEIELMQEIESLKNVLKSITGEKRHISEVMHLQGNSASIIQSVDDKYDFYSNSSYFPQQNIPSFYLNTTNPIFISKDILNGPIEDKVIPIEVGIGTYKYMLDNYDIHAETLPVDYVLVPNGKQICQSLTLSSFTNINILDLKPMMSLAKKHHFTFISDTTGYLARIRYENGHPMFDFRIRACYEKNPVIDPLTQF